MKDKSMTVYPNAKINLGLFITGRRSDGYHLLETGFLPIPLCDVLELSVLAGEEEDRLEVVGGIETGALSDNLVLRAVRALRAVRPFPALSLRLAKHVPSGAGMGGGSADASFTLTAVNELCALGLSTEELEQIALGLGADCPIFVRNQPALGRGIGEVLTPLTLPQLAGYHLAIVKPEVHISTAEAFRGLLPIEPRETSLEVLLRQPVSSWSSSVINDFEPSLFPRYSELKEIKAELYRLGADFALMTGSGAALYALSKEPLSLKTFEKKGYFLWLGRI